MTIHYILLTHAVILCNSKLKERFVVITGKYTMIKIIEQNQEQLKCGTTHPTYNDLDNSLLITNSASLIAL